LGGLLLRWRPRQGRGGHVVRARDPDGLEALERGPDREIRREVRVVEARAVRPAEAIGSRLGPECQTRVPIGDDSVLEVPGERPDGSSGDRGARTAEAVARRVAVVGGLRPGLPGVEREVHTRNADPRRERTRAPVAALLVDLVVRAGD